jgi:hypothetical protein
MSAHHQLAFKLLLNQFPRGALRGEWLKAFQDALGGPTVQGSSPDSFDRIKANLIADGSVEADGKGKGVLYRPRCGKLADEVIDLDAACDEAADNLAGIAD